MALHIQMSEEAEKEYKRLKLRGMLSSFGAASALSLAFGLTLTFTVIYFATDPPAEFLAYVPPAEDLPPRAVPTTPQLSSKAATPSNTVAPSVIVSTGAAPVAMAQIDTLMDDSADDGLSIEVGIGLDTGLGDDLGDAGGGMGSSQPAGSALEGTFYDLKLSKAGAPTGITPQTAGKVHKILNTYLKNWSKSTFARYYQSRAKLYASNWCLPSCNANYAVHAFQCKDKCKGSAWVVVYRGKVKAPKTGTFRFVGTGDDLIAVRFDGKMVLEAGWAIPSMYDDKKPNECGNMGAVAPAHGQKYHRAIREKDIREKRDYEFIMPKETKKWNKELGGLTAGNHFKVKEGSSYPIEILISEIPGGAFGFVLFIQDITDGVKKNAPLDIFRTNFSVPDMAEVKKLVQDAKCLMGNGEMECPAFNGDSPIWIAVP